VLGDWQDHYDRFAKGQPPTEGELREWWSRWPDAKVGLQVSTVVMTQHAVLIDAESPTARIALRLGGTLSPSGRFVRMNHEIATKVGALTDFPSPPEPWRMNA